VRALWNSRGEGAAKGDLLLKKKGPVKKRYVGALIKERPLPTTRERVGGQKKTFFKNSFVSASFSRNPRKESEQKKEPRGADWTLSLAGGVGGGKSKFQLSTNEEARLCYWDSDGQKSRGGEDRPKRLEIPL